MNYILPLLYGCENWSLTLREEHNLGVFEKVLKIYGRTWEQVTGYCRIA
jgi:hypothetical protein